MGDREIPEGWERRADGDARIGAVIVGLRKKIRVSDYLRVSVSEMVERIQVSVLGIGYTDTLPDPNRPCCHP
jgi:hypothetical protein